MKLKDYVFKYFRLKETTKNFVCNCTESGSFGILCEYQFSNNTFLETIQYQYDLKKRHFIGSQLFGNITYHLIVILECDV